MFLFQPGTIPAVSERAAKVINLLLLSKLNFKNIQEIRKLTNQAEFVNDLKIFDEWFLMKEYKLVIDGAQEFRLLNQIYMTCFYTIAVKISCMLIKVIA